MTRFRWIAVSRACVIVALGGFEAIHVGTGAYLPLGIGIVVLAVGVGVYAYTRARTIRR